MFPRCSRANIKHQTRKLEYVLAHVIKNKNNLHNYHSLKWNYKSNPVYSSLFKRWVKKRGMSTFVSAGEISCSPTLIFQGITLSSEATGFS